MPQKYVTVDGVATLVTHRGPTTLPGAPPDTSQGATVVCLHDAGTSGGWFDGVLDALASSHSPLAYDQPGHGRSAGLDALASIEAMVDHLAGLLGAWDLTDPVLVGDGLGAVVAIEAARRPGLVRAVVAVGAVADTFDLAEEIDELAAITAGRARRNFDRSGYGPDAGRPVYEKAFASWVTTDPRATLGARRAQAAWSLAEPPAVPVLVVTGEHTEAGHAAAAARLAERLPAATTHELAGAGRRGAIEQPDQLVAAIDRFLAAEVATAPGASA